MAEANVRRASALEALDALQAAGRHAIRSQELTRSQRELLLRQGLIREVMKGWYVASDPKGRVGEGTSWYAVFWRFCGDYLAVRFGSDWVLAPEQSLRLFAGDTSVPAQVLIRAPRGRNQVTRLIHDTSFLEIRQDLPSDEDMVEEGGLRRFRPEAALAAAGPAFFTRYPIEARTALASQEDASGVLTRLLRDGRSTVAGRLAGAFRNIGRDREAAAIVAAMQAAGFQVRVVDPFETKFDAVLRREPSPCAADPTALGGDARRGRSPLPRPPRAR